MGKIPQEIIDRILDRIDIVEVISGYLQVKKTGRNFKACCPFHNEKTPSFVVSPDKQIYHCFGCHAGGNAINFVMKYESLEFPEALRMLASRAGVELPKYERTEGPEDSLASAIYEINKMASAYYQNALRSDKGRKAMEYLKKRGIESPTLAEFRIGYAPDGWESLRKYCMSKGVKADLLRKAGLSIPSEKGKGDYDRFRNRIMFPIYNERGSIVAFGGRVMDKSLPKYINSPETLVYSKSNVLYGLNFSKRGIRDQGYAILVEGYMDVIIPFQRGITNIVATSGTALTPRQVSILKKYTDTSVMVFDADQAGQAASLRGLDIMIQNGMKVRIVTLPEGEDPDSFLTKAGKDAFLERVSKAKDLFTYKLDLLIQKQGLRDISGIVDEMLPTISKVESAVVQSDYLRKLAERLGIHEASLRHEMGKVNPDRAYHFTREDVDKIQHNYRSSEVHLLGLSILDESRFRIVEKELGVESFHDLNVRKVMETIKDIFDRGEKGINPGKLLSRFEKDENLKAAVVQALAKADITEEPERALRDCIFCVRKENREEKLKDLTVRLKKAQETRNDPEMKKIMDKINQIHKEKVI
jgi:DNA primase